MSHSRWNPGTEARRLATYNVCLNRKLELNGAHFLDYIYSIYLSQCTYYISSEAADFNQ